MLHSIAIHMNLLMIVVSFVSHVLPLSPSVSLHKGLGGCSTWRAGVPSVVGVQGADVGTDGALHGRLVRGLGNLGVKEGQVGGGTHMVNGVAAAGNGAVYIGDHGGSAGLVDNGALASVGLGGRDAGRVCGGAALAELSVESPGGDESGSLRVGAGSEGVNVGGGGRGAGGVES